MPGLMSIWQMSVLVTWWLEVGKMEVMVRVLEGEREVRGSGGVGEVWLPLQCVRGMLLASGVEV